MRHRPSFREKFSTYSNENLVDILHDKSDYLPEALEAAKAVIAERSIPDQELQYISQNLQEKKAKRLALAKKPLSLEEKIAFIFIPLIGMVVFFIAQVTYHEKGLDRKKSESLTYTLIGFGIWVLLGFAISTL